MRPALWHLARRAPRVTLAVALGVALLGVLWLAGRSTPRGSPAPPGNPLRESRLLTPEVELRGVVRQLQEDTAVLRKSLDDVTRALQEMRETKGSAGDAALSAREIERLKRQLGPLPPPPVAAAAPAPAAPPPPPAVPVAPPPPETPRITVFTVGTPAPAAPAPAPAAPPPPPAVPVAPPPETPRITVFTVGKPAPAAPAPPGRWVHLPAGSFVKATLLSGVYAPVRAQQPLPVLLHFTEAPVGPNATRVPLRGCVAVARALGEFTTKRAGLQLDTLSCVLPSGRAVSQPVTGWVAGPDGIFGMPGELVEREGPYLARVSLAGFLHGASAAFAAAQTTTSIGALGNTTTTVTGNEALYGALSGFANTATRMAAFYERQLESLVPAIHVPSGLAGSAVIQGGVTLDGVELEQLLAREGGASWAGLD